MLHTSYCILIVKALGVIVYTVFKNIILLTCRLHPSGQTVEENWTLFKQYIFAIINKFVPTKYVKRNNDLPWINRELKRKLKKGKTL